MIRWMMEWWNLRVAFSFPTFLSINSGSVIPFQDFQKLIIMNTYFHSSVYSDAIRCEKTLIDAECRYTGVNKELIELTFDGYNPFCASLQTPTPTHGVPVHSPTTTSRVVLPNVGSCRYREYNNKIRVCTTAFFVNMRRDPNGQCR